MFVHVHLHIRVDVLVGAHVFGCTVHAHVRCVLQALSKLHDIETQLNATSLPQNSQALAEQHNFLSGLITETSTAALHEGRVLLERVRRSVEY